MKASGPHNQDPANDEGKDAEEGRSNGRPSEAQLRYLRLGAGQPGGKLPLFDENGQEISAKTIRACVEKGWAEPWFANPVKPDWLVCRLTDKGRRMTEGG